MMCGSYMTRQQIGQLAGHRWNPSKRSKFPDKISNRDTAQVFNNGCWIKVELYDPDGEDTSGCGHAELFLAQSFPPGVL